MNSTPSNSSSPQLQNHQFLTNLINAQTLNFLSYHFITIFVVSLIILTILINHYGTRKNLLISTKAKNIINQFLGEHFNNYTGQLIQEAPHIIKLYASGRQSCIFGIFAFALIPRQQILSFFLNFMIFNVKDQLVVQIPIRTSSILPLTMAIVRKKNIRQITKKKFPDIKNFCKQYKPINKQTFNVPESHAILVEKKDHVQYLLKSERDVEIWERYGKFVKLVYLSDINKFSRYPMALRMVINLNEQDLSKNNGEGLLGLMEWMMSFVDRMSKVKMGVNEKKEGKKKREGVTIEYDQF